MPLRNGSTDLTVDDRRPRGGLPERFGLRVAFKRVHGTRPDRLPIRGVTPASASGVNRSPGVGVCRGDRLRDTRRKAGE
jgi:hypothetical protein